jgi:hypothetical protein
LQRRTRHPTASTAATTSETTAESKRIILNDIYSKSDEFFEHDLSALKDNNDLVAEVVEIRRLYDSVQYHFARRATSQ